MKGGSLDCEPTSSTFSFPFFGEIKWNTQTIRILSAESQQTRICENPHLHQNMEGLCLKIFSDPASSSPQAAAFLISPLYIKCPVLELL